MLLAIDIGNTTIAAAIFKRGRIFRKSCFFTRLSTDSKVYFELMKLLKSSKSDKNPVKTAVISSVVPSATKTVVRIIRKRFGIKTLIIGEDIKVPIKNLYLRPKQVGQDRLVNAFACLRLYGAPAIIVDFGTATTFDYLDTKGSYAGGLITPGVEISIDALAQRTALLPKIRLKKPKGLIGKETVESIRSGVLYGLSSMCDGVVEKIRAKHSSNAKVVATGGLATFFASYCKDIDYVDNDLTLKGINLIYSPQVSHKNFS